MRVARTLFGILLVTVSVLAFVVAGLLWTLAGHEGPDGGFDTTASGLSTTGYALVVPDIDALLRAHAPFTRAADTTLRIDATTPTGPAFVGLAPLAAVQTYLGPAPYGRIDAVHLGAGGLPVGVTGVAAPAAPAGARPATGIPGGAPAAQRFWVAASVGGRLAWTPGARHAGTLALVVMRPDAGASVQVTAVVTVRPGWIGAATVGLFAAGTALGMIAVALLLWPTRRREIVYVVEPAQLPEIAHRLGLPTTGSVPTAQPLAAATGTPESAATPGSAEMLKPTPDSVKTPEVPVPRIPEKDPVEDAGARGDAVDQGATAETATGEPLGGVPADGVDHGEAGVPVAPHQAIPAVFADPRTRPTSLRTAMLLHPPTPTNARGVYRTVGTPPPVTPDFEQPVAVEPTEG